tara:strand:+ start:620 stop:1006 length:387 start_codon:yes stop_codon:yes gene_type:complete
MKTKSKIYIIHFKDGKKIIGKSLIEIHNKYIMNSNNNISFDRFRYIINNDLYNSDKTYIHKGVEYQYKLNDIEKVVMEFLEDYFKDTFINYMKQKEQLGYTAKEYKDSVKKMKYTQFYNQFKIQVECN